VTQVPLRRELIRFAASALPGARLRVLFVTNMWPDELRPDYGTFIQTQAQSLEAASVAVDVLMIRGHHSKLAYAVAPGAVARLSRSRAYDVVHIHTGHAAIVSLGSVPRPVVVSFVGADLLGQPRERGLTFKSRAEVTLFRQLARAATRTITKSQEMEDALPAAVRARNHVIPNGVDLSAFAPVAREQARAALGWSTEEQVALFLGDPKDPRKNIALARAAVERAACTAPRLRLHEAWGSRPEEVPQLMWAADCLVLSSRSEGSPNVVKEAMAAGLPVVATPVGDVIKRLTGVEGGFVVTPEPGAVARALERAVALDRAPALREAVLPLSLPVTAQRVIDVYEHACAGARANGG
jgi:teichuronic acid biosynthesis glycosyltransferase TuaC